ncbi:MarR family winged helix-turn-helix transcriptional regulator [Collinsella tanakaei]|uniref:MarR family winged helix-turn-helix transcriptional regulator n=1 Tax=Collinsella tanakaei TaxID=626935 RepID=UPI0025A38FA7|nr:MarR family transcriptional regulator [Collinsella tanakaei]MDM8299626.1 MarR family transcriptional regulator [Collinsella tanakaei]
MEEIAGSAVPGESRVDTIHHQLLVAFSHSNRAMLGHTRGEGLMPGQPKVLEYLAEHDGCNQRAIARACVMDKSTVTSVLARMEEGGLIERRTDPRDRRGISVVLTERGRAAAMRVCAFGDEVDEVALAGLSDGERMRLQELLARVIGNFERAEGNR